MDSSTGLIDFDTLAVTVKLFPPRLLIVGASAYPRILDYARFRKIADSAGALMMVDMVRICQSIILSKWYCHLMQPIQ